MIPIAVGIYFVLIDALFAMLIGALTGAVASFCLGVPRIGIAKNGLLGSLGFFAGYVTCIVVSLVSPHNTSSLSIQILRVTPTHSVNHLKAICRHIFHRQDRS